MDGFRSNNLTSRIPEQPVLGLDMPSLRPQPPPRLRALPPLRPRPPSTQRPQPLPRLRPQPAPQRRPGGIAMMRGPTRQNKIVMGEKSPVSSRGQCVKFPPIPCSSRANISDHSLGFERVLQQQDNLIKSLVDELSEREQRRSELTSSARLLVDNLLKRHLSRLEESTIEFNTRLEKLCSDFYTERELILLQNQQEIVYAEKVIFSMEKQFNVVDDETRRDYKSSREQMKKQYKEEYQKMKKQTEEVMKKLRRKQRREPLGPGEKRVTLRFTAP